MLAALKLERSVLLDQAYGVLKERILDRAMEPGQRLNIDALGRELAVSSTPIREALGRLAAEGVVRFEPFIGFSVAPMPDRKYYDDLYALRLLIEPWASGEAARLQDTACLEAIQAAVVTMREGTLSKTYRTFHIYSEADQAFHEAIFAGAGNEAAMKAYGVLNVHLHISRLYIDREQDTEESLAEHEGILSAVLAGDPFSASRAMEAHIRSSRQKLLE
jgi:DNA-binding GntR family transcriptional regulator